MADLRRATLPESLSSYARSLGDFSQAAIDDACKGIERSPRQDFEPPFPELGRMIDACRRAEIGHKNIPLRHCDMCDDMRMLIRRRAGGGTYAVECDCKKGAVIEAEIDRKARAAGQ